MKYPTVGKPAELVFRDVLQNVSGFNHKVKSDNSVIVTFTEAEASSVLASLTAMAMGSPEDSVKAVAGSAGLKLYKAMQNVNKKRSLS